MTECLRPKSCDSTSTAVNACTLPEQAGTALVKGKEERACRVRFMRKKERAEQYTTHSVTLPRSPCPRQSIEKPPHGGLYLHRAVRVPPRFLRIALRLRRSQFAYAGNPSYASRQAKLR